MTTRLYSYKDVDMLMASKTISKSLSANLAELAITRSTWTEAYATDLSARIDLVIEKFLGLDKKKEQRDATAYLNSISQTALRNLKFIKTQIGVDFPTEAAEIFKNLGLPKNLKALQGGHQEELIQLLFAFKKGMTDDLKNRIIEKGANPELINTLIGYAAELQQANTTQESLKQTSQQVSEEALVAFNGVYTEIIGICKIASGFYQNEPLKKDLFTFSTVVAKMGVAPTKKEKQKTTN